MWQATLHGITVHGVAQFESLDHNTHNMQIYITRNGKQEGPLSFEQVRSRAAEGSLDPTDLAWYEGCAEWIQLDRIPGVFASPPPPPIVTPEAKALSPSDESVSQVRPWVRYWARFIDIYIFSICSGFILGFVAPSLLPANNLLLGLLFVFLWCFIEPMFLLTWGATPGKALLRVSVRNSDRSLLNYGSALSRSFDVWFRGLGLGIPLVALFTQLSGYNTLTTNGITSWDQSRNLRVSHEKIGAVRIILAILLFFFFAYIMHLGSQKV